jgi:uncharacterized membrane protein
MPFFDDSGVRPEEHRGPIWSAFAILGDQVERMVALNIAWSVQLVPMLLGLGFSDWPTGLRALLVIYTGLVLGPATGALFGLVVRAAQGELLRVELAVEVLREVFQPSLVTLVPLYSGFAWLAAVAWLAATVQLPVVDVLVQVIALLLALCSIYWGPLFALQPGLSAWGILRESVRLVWRQPGETLRSALVILAALALGVVSVGGTFLIVPVVVALLQVQLYRFVSHG